MLLSIAVCAALGGAAGLLTARPAPVIKIEDDADDVSSIAYSAAGERSRSHRAPGKCDSPQAECQVANMNVDAGLKYAIQIIDTMEGTAMVAFLDTLAKPPVWTIGHGTTKVNGKPVHQGMRCTQAECDAWAQDDMRSAANFIVANTRVALTDWQLGALISFTYNEGKGAYFNSSVREALNQGLYSLAANRLLEYDVAGGRRLRGLDTRRGRERAMFLGLGPQQFTTFIAPPVLSQPAAPTAISDADRLNQEQIAKFT